MPAVIRIGPKAVSGLPGGSKIQSYTTILHRPRLSLQQISTYHHRQQQPGRREKMEMKIKVKVEYESTPLLSPLYVCTKTIPSSSSLNRVAMDASAYRTLRYILPPIPPLVFFVATPSQRIHIDHSTNRIPSPIPQSHTVGHNALSNIQPLPPTVCHIPV